ncbi:hypothetical protein K435DRAFT_963806 [Dendrothele bispora CBS 962.96]|uniref:HTH psq-type domain-containing protein n=1 Tax=Dendrothele bispora (strain CBS 962.96) TaxID=1314807 RepID=A0A4S8ME62_DENBC|nr:hypothetical protein K435DRAFT_963806 [Dendrothele bispora CBS 962.96]
MVNKAISQRTRDHEASETRQANLEKATAAYLEDQKKTTGERKKGLRQIAEQFGVDKTTLNRRVHGGQSIQEFNTTKQKLTPAEEKVIVDHIIERAQRALAPTRTQIQEFANHILEEKYGARNYEPSVKGSFALTQTSPIKAIAKSFRAYVPSSFDADPSHATVTHQPISSPVALGNLEISSASSPATPTPSQKRARHDTDSGLLEDTPSKRMRMLTSNLSATSSASFLTSKTPYTSDIPFPRLLKRVPVDTPEPDWSLTKTSADPRHYVGKEAMGHKIEQLTKALADAERLLEIAGQNEETWAAQAVLQDMTLSKMNKVVHAKEEERAAKKDKSSLTLPGPGEGYGRIWTDQAILDYKRKKREEEEREAAEKKQRATEKEEMRAKRAEIEADWKDIMEKHRLAVTEWEEDCKILKEQKVKKKDWPPKPTHISKKELTAKRLGNYPSTSLNPVPSGSNSNDNDRGLEEDDRECEVGSDDED